MSERLTLVQRTPFCAPAVRVPARWRKLAMAAYAEAAVDLCEDPELLADRLGIEIVPSDDAHAELIGNVIFLPDGESFEEMGLLVYELIARALLVRNGDLPDVAAVAAVSAELALPRCVARGANPRTLTSLNPYVSLDLLRQIYMSHRECSGEIPAVG